MADFDTQDLTDPQFVLVMEAFPFPAILKVGGMKAVATSLAKKGWGSVEDGASGERIFRLSEAGSNAVAEFKHLVGSA